VARDRRLADPEDRRDDGGGGLKTVIEKLKMKNAKPANEPLNKERRITAQGPEVH
jgi:hypothetical protein